METGLDRIRGGVELLAEDLGIALQLDGNDACAIEFNDGMVCTVEYIEERNALLLSGELVDVTEVDRDQLFRRALVINANPLQAGGPSIGFEENTLCLVLSYICPAESLDADGIADTIGNFMLVLVDIRDALQQQDVAPRSAEPPRSFDNFV